MTAAPARSLLANGQVFPDLAVRIVGGQTLAIPGNLEGAYAVVLFYRGSWCPYCCAQLAAFSRAYDRLAAAGVQVVALSVDDEKTSTALVARLRLTFPVGYGADVTGIATITGAFVGEKAEYLQSTGFVLDRQGKVLVAVYSSGAIGRLVPDDVIGFVRYVDGHAHQDG
jgi:peroxiredoxin